MIYLASQDFTNDFKIDEYSSITIIKFISESKSLYDINPIIRDMDFPIIGAIRTLRLDGFEVIFRINNILYYLIDAEHDKMKIHIREFKIDKLNEY